MRRNRRRYTCTAPLASKQRSEQFFLKLKMRLKLPISPFSKNIVGADAHIRPQRHIKRDDIGIVPYIFRLPCPKGRWILRSKRRRDLHRNEPLSHLSVTASLRQRSRLMCMRHRDCHKNKKYYKSTRHTSCAPSFRQGGLFLLFCQRRQTHETALFCLPCQRRQTHENTLFRLPCPKGRWILRSKRRRDSFRKRKNFHHYIKILQNSGFDRCFSVILPLYK